MGRREAHILPLIHPTLGEGEVERGSFPYSTIRPNAAPVSVNDPLHCGQPDPGAFKFACVVKPLEGPEQAVGIRHVETGAVVPNEACSLAIIFGQPKLYPGLFLLSGVLPSVAQEVFQGHSQQSGVPVQHHAVLDHELHLSLRVAFFKAHHDGPG